MLRKANFIILLVIAFTVVYSSFYIVYEGQRALVLQYGKLQTLQGPGLHLKWPFVSKIYELDLRWQTLVNEGVSVTTADKKNLLVNYYLRWKIQDPAKYFSRTNGDKDQAIALLQQKANEILQAPFINYTAIAAMLQQSINNYAQNLGVSVIDAQISGIGLTTENSKAVIERMKAEQERLALQYREQAKTSPDTIKLNADNNAALMVANAKQQAVSIRSQGDAQADQVYIDAASKNPNFFAFYRSLQVYKKVFAKDTVVVLKPDSEFLKYFNFEPKDKGSH